jgi:hypothetical protein
MATLIVRRRSTSPSPPQARQGSAITEPSPPHCGQVRATVKKPWVKRTWPRPPQALHGRGGPPPAEPLPWQSGQASRRGMVSSRLSPNAASSNDSVRS